MNINISKTLWLGVVCIFAFSLSASGYVLISAAKGEAEKAFAAGQDSTCLTSDAPVLTGDKNWNLYPALGVSQAGGGIRLGWQYSMLKLVIMHVTLFTLAAAATRMFINRIQSDFDAFARFFNRSEKDTGTMGQNRLNTRDFKILASSANRMVEEWARAKKTLKDSEARFFALFEQSPFSMQLFAPDGYIRRANRAYENCFGQTEYDLIISNFNMLHSNQVATAGLKNHIKRGFEDGFVELPEARMLSNGGMPGDESCRAGGRLKKGGPSWLRSYIYPVRDEEGKVLEVVVTHEDVTERKQAEDSLQKLNNELEIRIHERTAELKITNEKLVKAKEEAELANRAKSIFLENITHDLRTPLTAIREASSMLIEGIFEGMPEKQHELLSIAKNECERLINSVNRILDLSCMEANMMDYHFSYCELAPVIRRSILKLAPIARKKNISLELMPPPDLPLIKMDPERIMQVVDNLLGNALKFSSEGGAVVIEVTLKKDGKDGVVEISVSDNGCGMDSSELNVIFEKFRQLGKGRKRAKGTGLGLYISKFIITAHGGEIWAHSRKDKGSAFFFTLPLYSGSSENQERLAVDRTLAE